jgi:DNA polymerase III epsilon subunit-like protein
VRTSGLADAPGTALPLESATYVVVDLETTGLSPGTSSICEIGAVRVRGLELEERSRRSSTRAGRFRPRSRL